MRDDSNAYWTAVKRLLTTVIALPGVFLYAYMLKAGLIDESIGDAGKEGEGDVRSKHPQDKPGKA